MAIKYYKTITEEEWRSTLKDYKSIIKGVHYKMYLTNKGTALCPVKVLKKRK